MSKRKPRAEKVGEELCIPVTLIENFKKQPREHFDEEALRALGESMRAIGQLIPVQVRPLPGGRYQLIEGERRWRAAKMYGIPNLLATTKEVRNREHQYLLSAAANVGREGYTPQETVNLIVAMMESRELERQVTQEKRARIRSEAGTRRKGRAPRPEATDSDKIEKIAATLGHSAAWVYQYLWLRRLDATVFRQIKAVGETGGMTFTTAKDLASFVPDNKPLQKLIAKRIITENMSNRESRTLMRRAKLEAGYGAERKDSSGRSTRHSTAGRLVKNVIGRTQRETSLLLDLEDETISAALEEFTDDQLEHLTKHIDASMVRLRKLQMMIKNRDARRNGGRSAA